MNVGVIGLGYWGPNLIRNLLESQRANVHCFDTNPLAMVRLKSRFPSVTFSTSSKTLLQHCDAVMIATPVLTHYSLVKEALEAGKGVFVEKPLSSSSAEALELIQLGRAEALRADGRSHFPLQSRREQSARIHSSRSDREICIS